MKTANSFRCLIVEDNDDHADLLSRAIVESHPTVVIERVATTAEALGLLDLEDRERPIANLILLDLKLVGVSGHDVLKAIKQDQCLCVIPVVVLTTSMSTADRHTAQDLNANSYLVKPTDYDQFRGMIRDLMSYWISWNAAPPPVLSSHYL